MRRTWGKNRDGVGKPVACGGLGTRYRLHVSALALKATAWWAGPDFAPGLHCSNGPVPNP
jgi:hypothetical protein